MATDKKGFILYADLIHTVNQLPSDKAGDLFKHILSYVNDENPVTEDVLIKIAFEPIKQQLKRDLDKWSTTLKGKSTAGKASAEARRLKKEQSSTNPTRVKSVQQSSTNPTVSVNVNDNVNVNVNDSVIKELSNSQVWKEGLAKFNNCNTMVIEKQLSIFLQGQELDENLDRNLEDIKKHFRAWLSKQDLRTITQKRTIAL